VVVVRIGGAGDSSRAVGAGRLRHIPWPLAVLALGAGLATLPIYLYDHFPALLLPAIVIAFLVIVVGLVGLGLHSRRDRLREAKETEHPPPQIYRQESCAIERPLLEKLLKAEQALKERIADRQWNADWASHQKHYDLGDQLLRQNDLDGAFREYSRAMQILLAVFQQQHSREEVFQPLWDKA
jgi:hypothetical protein